MLTTVVMAGRGGVNNCCDDRLSRGGANNCCDGR